MNKEQQNELIQHVIGCTIKTILGNVNYMEERYGKEPEDRYNAGCINALKHVAWEIHTNFELGEYNL